MAAIAIGSAFALRGPFYALLFYLWIAYFRPETWLWYDFVTGLNLSLIVGVYLLGATVASGHKFRLDFRSGLLLLFVAHNLLSTLQSAQFDFAWPFWQQFAKAILITYLFSVLVTDGDRYRTVLVTIALSLGSEAAKQGWLGILTSPGTKNDNELPFLGDNNGVAVGMMMLVPILSALARTARLPSERHLYRFMAIGVAYRGIATYSRGGFLSAGVLALLHVWRSPARVRAIVSTCFVLAIIVPIMPDAFWDRMSTITTSEEEMDSSAAGRLHFWRVAVRMAGENPLLGVGHNAYNVAYDDYDHLDGAYGRSRSVHSVWFGILAEVGYVGLAMFLMIVALAFLACRQVRRKAATMPAGRDLGQFALALETSLTVFAVGGIFVPSQYLEMAWHLIGLATALRFVAQAGEPASAATVRSAPSARPAVPAAAVAFVPVRHRSSIR